MYHEIACAKEVRGHENSSLALTEPRAQAEEDAFSDDGGWCRNLRCAKSPPMGVTYLVERGTRPGLNAALAWSAGALIVIRESLSRSLLPVA